MMKQAIRQSISSQSCSCTSCLYKSGSERPSLRRFVAQGSRIDKLYYGKYLPLRERKLLEKLVKTRAVYDDVRNQLLSGSSSSITKPNLKALNRVPITGKGHKAANGGDISALVDLVDKGAVSPSNVSSECCSCCSCSSKLNLHDKVPGTNKHGRRGQYMTSKSSVISSHRKRNEYEPRKNVRFMTKRIRSDPCTCTLKLSGMIKRQTKSVLKKIHPDQPEPMLERHVTAEERRPKMLNKAKNIKRSLNAKIKRSKIHLRENMEETAKKSLTKLRESKTKLKENFENIAKTSLEKIKLTTRTNDEYFEATQVGDVSSVENVNERPFIIKKDSLTKFKEKLRRKRNLKSWECEHECLPGECVHKECLNKIIKRKASKRISKNYRNSLPEQTKYERRVGDTPSKSDMRTQAREAVKSIGTEKQSPATRKTDFNKGGTFVERNDNIQIKQKPSKEKGTLSDTKSSVTIACKCLPKHPTKSVKTLNSLPRSASKHSMETASFSSVNISKKNNQHKSRSGSKVNNTNNLRKENVPHRHVSVAKPKHLKEENVPQNSAIFTKAKRSKEEQLDLNKSRQAVRIGSSFSFNVEFYKEKPAGKSSEVKFRKEPKTTGRKNNYELKKNDKHNEPRKPSRHQSKKKQYTRRNTSTKNTQSIGHPLKRCFCTLKLKTKKTTSVSVSIQTPKMPPPRTLLPYECEPLVCIPGKCNPKECEILIRKRSVQYHSKITNAKPRSKSASSLTIPSGSNVTSKRIQAIKQPVRYKPSTNSPVTENKPKKQAVRIGSTFSFDIEFSKANPIYSEKKIMDTAYAVKKKGKINHNPKRNKSVDKAKEYIVHKYSQISSSGGKSKYTLTKNSLRRCFCTTKLNKYGKRKIKAKVVSKSKITTKENFTTVGEKPNLKSVSLSTKKKAKIQKPIQLKLLPYECEPGVCVPDECDPYKCKDVLIKRQAKPLKRHTRKLNTENIKTISSSSFTRRSVTPSKTKNIQSVSETHTGHKQHSKKSALPRKQSKSLICYGPHRQAVRVGSAFSFDVEFFKEKVDHNEPILSVHKPSKYAKDSKKNTIKNRDTHSPMKSKLKSELVQAKKKNKNISIGPAIKRCFCTLKLHKVGKQKNRISSGTNTAYYNEKTVPKSKTSSVGTKIKENFKEKNQLKWYECEPNICVPGDCDPDRCLDIIKKRDYRRLLYEKGVTTNPSKMRSVSSSTQKIVYKSKNTYIQSKTKTPRKSIKKAEPTPEFKLSNRSANINYANKQSRQSVRVGSKFSFDIEFYKNRSNEKNVLDKVQGDRGDSKTNEALKNKIDKPMSKPLIQHKSQGVEIKKNHKAIGIKPIFKRCFCTLNLQKKAIGTNKMSNHLQRTNRQSKVYTVSRMTVEKCDMKTATLYEPTLIEVLEAGIHLSKCSFEYKNEMPILNSNSRRICSENSSYSNITSRTTIQLKSKEMRSYFCRSNYNLMRAKTEDYTFQNISLRHNSRIKPKLEIKARKGRSTQTRSLAGRDLKVLENQSIEYIEPEMTELTRRITDITGVSPYLSRCFCTMNLQIANQKQVNKNKPATVISRTKYHIKKSKIRLEPYECEPGICVPDQCNPIACKELIMKRLMKTVSKMSSTEKHLKSSSSETHNPFSTLKAKKNQSMTPVLPTTKSPKRNLSKAKYEKSQSPYKQAVRIGSNFSFNIEFSKDASNASVHRESKTPSRSKQYKSMNTSNRQSNKGTRGIKRYSNDGESQSISKTMENKASTATPRSKRCFCTLKLQKKGIDLTIASKKNNAKWKPMLRNDNMVQIRTADSSQNTKPFKHSMILEDLAPYERQPHLCVPEQCNPHECLEKIKRRVQPSLSTPPEAPKTSQSFLKQCFCALKRLAAAKETKTKMLNIEPEKSAQTVNTRQDNFITLNANLKPYECEPYVCTPGECDPYECQKLIRKRNLKRESGTSTKEFTRKSTSSMAKRVYHSKYINAKPIVTQKKTIPRRKPKNISKLTKSVKGSDKQSKLKQSLDETVFNPHRQAVRIGSNFSFNIEFSKNKSYDEIKKISTSPETKIRKHHKSSYSSTRKSSMSAKHKKNQQTKTFRHRDTQIFTKRVRSTMTQATPFLKRCFCTLKLYKAGNTLTTASKKTTANFPQKRYSNNIRSVVNTAQKATRTPKKLHNDFLNLKPYECEPGVCMPGNCDPYECEKRIKLREKKMCSKFVNTAERKEMTRFVSTATESKAKKSQAKSYSSEEHHNYPDNITERDEIADYTFKESPIRQTVHIGSSFSFDVQFYKDKSLRSSINTSDLHNISNISHKLVNNTGSTTILKNDNKSVGHDSVISHRQSQAQGPKMESKGSGVGLLLKRCFCTLKLQKYTNKQQLSQNSEKKSHLTYLTYNAATPSNNKSRIFTSLIKSISRKKQINPECDPNTCEQCNLDNIKKPKLTLEENKNNTFNYNKTCMCDAENTSKRNNISKNNNNSKGRLETCTCDVSSAGNVKKLSGDKEIKNKSYFGRCTCDAGDVAPSKGLENGSMKKNKSKRGPGKCTCDAGDAKPSSVLENTYTNVNNKYTGGKKKCLCDAVSKSRNIATTDEKKSKRHMGICDPCSTKSITNIEHFSDTRTVTNKSKGFPEKCPCDTYDSNSRQVQYASEKINKFKGFARKRALLQSFVLEPYECEPNTCTPGVCNPYACYDRIKRRHRRELGTETICPTNKTKFTLKVADNISTHTQKQNERGHVKHLNTKKQQNHNYKEESLDTKSSEDSQRQLVRIGSNFSFDLEFYKYRSLIDSGKKHMANTIKLKKSKKYIQTPKSQNVRSRGSERKSVLYSRKTQALINKHSKASGITPLLKRCFCTLSLQKSGQPMYKSQEVSDEVPKSVNDKPKQSGIIIKNRGTLTKIKHLSYNLEQYECEPGICIPGECNPYECEERIKKRDQKCKSKNMGTRDRCSNVSTMTKKALYSKAKRMQSDVPQRETRIVEQPRFPLITDLKNKQAVRIGSNFSVNIEFYKEMLPPKHFIDSKYLSENSRSKKVISNNTKIESINRNPAAINELGSHELQKPVKREYNTRFASDAIKRCFYKPCVPQPSPVFTVERVEESKTKPIISPPQYVVCNVQVQQSQVVTKNCACITNTPFSKTTKTATTKFDEKDVKNNLIKSSRNNQFNQTKKYSSKDSNQQTTNDMETILPYKPGKFNKKTSKASLMHDKKCLSYCKYNNQKTMKTEVDNKIEKKRSINISENAKRLTAKKGNKSIIEAKNVKICSVFNITSAICRCKQIFRKRKTKSNDTNELITPNKEPSCMSKKPKRLREIPQSDVLKQSKSDRRQNYAYKNVPEKSKSLKITKASKKSKCQCCYCVGGKKYSKFEYGDTNKEHINSTIANVIKPGTVSDQHKKVVQFIMDPANSYVNEVRKHHPTLVDFISNFMCTSNKKDNKLIQSSENQNVIAPNKSQKCKSKRDAGEGDSASKSYAGYVKQNPNFNNNKNVNKVSCPCCVLKQYSKKSQSTTKLEHLNEYNHPEYGAKLKITPKGSKTAGTESKRGKIDKKGEKNNVFQEHSNTQCKCETKSKKGLVCECIHMSKPVNIGESIINLIKPQKICACHSSRCECAKVYKRTQQTKKKLKKIMKLRERNLKLKIKREKYAKKHGKKNYVKNKKKTDKRKHKEYNARQNQYKKEDALRRKKRLASDKYLEKRLKSIKNTRDLLLAADSLYDIAKLGCTVVQDVARSSCRALVDPFHTYQRVKTTAKQPKRIWPIMKTAIQNSGVVATVKRVRRRIQAMQNFKSLKNKLRQYGVTNYLMNMTEKDPRKRMKRTKPKKGNIRKREPMDFQCSLYMASLRKRPYLCVYYTCPWFYPHFVTLLQGLKQFVDMLLFLLAVVVWSPCILCMELCRAMMCCFLCTG